jgi:hypothetical protein
MPPLARELPYWHIDEDGVIVSVDLRYSAMLALDGLDTECMDDGQLEAVTRTLHALLVPLEPGAQVQLLSVSAAEHERMLARYCQGVSGDHALGARLAREKVAAIRGASWLRRFRLYLVCTLPPAGQGAAGRAMPRKFVATTEKLHQRQRERILGLRSQLAQGLRAAGIGVHGADGRQVEALLYEFLNPGRSRIVAHASSLPSLFDGRSVRERLVFSSVREEATELVCDGQRMRVISMRGLPTATAPALLERLTVGFPYACRAQMALEVLEQQAILDRLKRRRNQATMHATRAQNRNQEAEAAARDVEDIIDRALSSAIRIVQVAVTVVLSVDDWGESSQRMLDAQTQEVLRAFAGMQGAEGRVEEYSQLDGWLSTLPANAGHKGGGHAARWHTCTSENAAHLMPVWQGWAGHVSPRLLCETSRNGLVGLDPFDPSLPGPNAFVAGATGSGKSTTMNYLLSHLLASGAKALIIDVGGSYRRLIELFGGQYLSFEAESDAAVNLFYDPGEMRTASGQLDPLRWQFVLTVLEVLLGGGSALLAEEKIVLDEAVKRLYQRAERAPTLVDLKTALEEGAWSAEDRPVAGRLARGLRLWTEGSAASLLSRPSNIRLTSDLVAFDLKGLPKHVQPAVILILSAIIWNLVMRDRSERKVVVFDEVWTLLDDPASVRLLAELYRTARKYHASIVAISQSVEDLTKSDVATALVQNSHTRYLLKHEIGHAEVARVFGLNERELEVFRGLEKRHGEYSEVLVCAGARRTVARVVLTPLEYWMATTDPRDLAALGALSRRLAGASQAEILEVCASRWPRGVAMSAEAAEGQP